MNAGERRELGGERVTRLFDRYLAAAEEGRDIAAALLAEAGDARADLEARIDLERELKALTREPEAPQGTARIGRFRLLQQLGQGGLGRVHLAHDPELGHQVALKVLDSPVLLDKEQRAWILNEARSLARIAHRGVVRVFDVGEAEGVSYVVMEHLPGPSLAELIQEWKRQRESGAPEDAPKAAVRDLAARLGPYSARIECLARLAEALGFCHDHGILHRDVKPQNVLFDLDGWPKLIDFGLAHVEGADEDSRLELTQKLVGTAAYTAPEQVASDQTGADPRSDQFTFATLAYECFALENPFQRKGRRATLDAVEAGEAAPLQHAAPAAPPDLVRVIRHAHERDPEARYPSLLALAADLRNILASRPISVAEPSLPHLARLWLRRHRRGVRTASASLVTFLLLLGAGWFATETLARNALLEELAAIRPEEFSGPEPFDQSYAALLELKQRARAYDEGWFRRTWIGATLPAAEERIHAWAAALGASHAAETQRSTKTGTPLQEVLYRRLFAQEEILCPECTENLAYRERGTLELPLDQLAGLEWSLAVVVPRVEPRFFLSMPMETKPARYPVPGLYWLQAWERGADRLAFESCFFVQEGWRPAVKVTLTAPRPEFLEESLQVKRWTRTVQGTLRQRVPAFRILPRLVTKAEYKRFLSATGFPQDSKTKLGPPDDPALPNLAGAMAFASWAGGRLPFSHELERAEELGLVALTPGPIISAEYQLDIDPGWKPSYFSYNDRSDRLNLKTVVEMDMRMNDGDRSASYIAGIGLRLVFPADELAAHRDAWLEPLVDPSAPAGGR